MIKNNKVLVFASYGWLTRRFAACIIDLLFVFIVPGIYVIVNYFSIYYDAFLTKSYPVGIELNIDFWIIIGILGNYSFKL